MRTIGWVTRAYVVGGIVAYGIGCTSGEEDTVSTKLPPPEQVNWEHLSPEEAKSTLIALGETVYTQGGTGGVACMTCHMGNGQGIPGVFPPLAGSQEAMGDCATHARYVLAGLAGEIVVQGKVYRGVMPGQPMLSDQDIAAVITYERNSWGNDYGVCLPSIVAKVRASL